MSPTLVFDTVDLLGVLVNGILGGVVARRFHMDIIGFTFLAVISGLGGGMVRDTLLQAGQPVALTNQLYLIAALAGATIAYFLPIRRKWANRTLLAADSLSVGCWAATGTLKGAAAGLGILPALMLGVITAVVGGATRDVLVGRVPAIFGGNTLYATVALVSSMAMYGFYLGDLPDVGMGVAIASSSVFTLAAHKFGWQLPGPASISARSLRRFMLPLFGRKSKAKREPHPTTRQIKLAHIRESRKHRGGANGSTGTTARSVRRPGDSFDS